MRRAQSLRTHNARAGSISSLSDDLGVLREQLEESPEDTLRRQLLSAERENDKLQAQVLALQDQLSQRPPIEQIRELEREYKNLELLLTGTQRENERCMAELERGKNREKMLERELARLAGENWQTSLNIPSANTSLAGRSGFLRTGDTASFFLPQAESTLAADATFDASGNSSSSFLSDDVPATPRAHPQGQGQGQAGMTSPPANAQTLSAALAHIAQVRALILGMEERMQVREGRLAQEVARAEEETRRLDTVKAEVDGLGLGLGLGVVS